MGRRVVIEPVSRIEGHARVTIELDAEGRVRDGRVEVTELRGFEAMCVGRPVREMPALTSRVCGICPFSHALAAARAGDAILGAEPPPTARKLRRLVQLGQWIESHALSFFLLSAPDLVPGAGADRSRRSFLSVAEAAPDLLRDGILLRRFGGDLVERAAGRRVHAAYAVAGGVARPLQPSDRDAIRAALPGALAAVERALAWWRDRSPQLAEDAARGAIETPFLALVGPGGELDPCGDALRLVSARGELLADGLDPAHAPALVGEEPVTWSRSRLAYWRALGFPQGAYRVGPLARLLAVSRCGTPRADRALEAFRDVARGPALSTFHAHGARLVEILFAVERAAALLDDPEIVGPDVLAPAAGVQAPEGSGACEAPRGTLFHRYRVDRDGLVTYADLVVATGQNAAAMNRAVSRVAAGALDGPRITEALLDRVEAEIRAFDPCLSCATHAEGRRAIVLRLLGPGGEVVDESAA